MPKSWFYVVSTGLQREKEQRKLIKLYEIGDSLNKNQINNLYNHIAFLDSTKKTFNDYSFFLENKIKIDSSKFNNKIIKYEDTINKQEKQIKSLKPYKTVTNIGILGTVLFILKVLFVK